MKSQIYNPAYIILARVVSVLMSPTYYFFNLFRKSYDFNPKILKTILVTEYHRIGDVIIIIPVLKSLKLKFPNSKIILVCNPIVAKLASEIGIADEIISFRAPWTEWEWSPFKWVGARALAKKVGKKDIDLVIDFKGDLRNSWFLWQIGGKNSLGYSTTGGSYFYTMPKPFPSKVHQADHAMELISYLGCEPFNGNKKFNYNKNNSIVLHPGATDPRRAWPNKYWIKLIGLLSVNEKVALVKTPETFGLIQQVIQDGLPVKIFEGDLIEFYHWLSGQKLFIGPDSMGGHLASFLNIPVISIFGSQDPKYTRPLGEWASCITPKTPCGHKRDHWRLCVKCMESIKPKIVYSKVVELISRVENEQ
jgi:ADP-heptose:LPS heptosyltransferase